MEQRCIGSESEKCLPESGYIGYHECVGKESKAWRYLKQKFLDQLLSHPRSQDAREILLISDEEWQNSVFKDCHYLSLRWGTGKNAITDEFRCFRNKNATRAIVYRLWLYDVEERIGG